MEEENPSKGIKLRNGPLKGREETAGWCSHTLGTQPLSPSSFFRSYKKKRGYNLNLMCGSKGFKCVWKEIKIRFGFLKRLQKHSGWRSERGSDWHLQDLEENAC